MKHLIQFIEAYPSITILILFLFGVILHLLRRLRDYAGMGDNIEWLRYDDAHLNMAVAYQYLLTAMEKLGDPNDEDFEQDTYEAELYERVKYAANMATYADYILEEGPEDDEDDEPVLRVVE